MWMFARRHGDEAALELAGPGGRVRVRVRLRTRKGVDVMIIEFENITDQHLSEAAVGSYVENRFSKHVITRREHGWVNDFYGDNVAFDEFNIHHLREGDVLHLHPVFRPVAAFTECPHCGYKFPALTAHLGQDHGLEVAS